MTGARAWMLALVFCCERAAALSARRVARRGLTMMGAAAPPETTGQIRFRFAPSPTGSLHVGGARTALYNWLAARKAGDNGRFVLRIEDTDLARSTRESEDSMLADLIWLGLDWDEGPRIGGPCELYRQSERSTIYKEAAQKMVQSGNAYPCFCTEEELEEKRKQAIAAGGAGDRYDGTWRDADPAVVAAKLAAGDPHVFRFKTQKGSKVWIDDLVRGRVEWDVDSTIGDFILLRSSGVPVYNFCVAVDDATMGVTTVVRADEHLTNTVRQKLVLEALGFPAPLYAHASLILGADRSKLSKRHGATSCGQFRERGYLPEAMINYLALLGWNSGTEQEVYSREELIEAFDLERVIPSPAMFDDAKLRWLNGQHLRRMTPEALASVVAENMRPVLFENADGDAAAVDPGARERFVLNATRMAQPKSELVTDITALARDALLYPLLETVGEPGDAADKKLADVLDDGFASFALVLVASYDRGEAPAWCYASPPPAASSETTTTTTFGAWLKNLGAATGRKKKQLFMPARLALTGRLAGPDVAEQLEVLSLAPAAGALTYEPLECRMAQLKQWATDQGAQPPKKEVTKQPLPATASSEGGTKAAPPAAAAAPLPPLSFEAFAQLRPVYEAHRRHFDDDRKMYDVLVAEHAKLRRKIEAKEKKAQQRQQQRPQQQQQQQQEQQQQQPQAATTQAAAA